MLHLGPTLINKILVFLKVMYFAEQGKILVMQIPFVLFCFVFSFILSFIYLFLFFGLLTEETLRYAIMLYSGTKLFLVTNTPKQLAQLTKYWHKRKREMKKMNKIIENGKLD